MEDANDQHRAMFVPIVKTMLPTGKTPRALFEFGNEKAKMGKLAELPKRAIDIRNIVPSDHGSEFLDAVVVYLVQIDASGLAELDRGH